MWLLARVEETSGTRSAGLKTSHPQKTKPLPALACIMSILFKRIKKESIFIANINPFKEPLFLKVKDSFIIKNISYLDLEITNYLHYFIDIFLYFS